MEFVPSYAYLVRLKPKRSDVYEVTKWSSERTDPEAIYDVIPHRNRCNCPVRGGRQCKHIKLVKRFIKDRGKRDPLLMYEESELK